MSETRMQSIPENIEQFAPSLDEEGKIELISGEKIPNRIGFMVDELSIGDIIPIGGNVLSSASDVRYLEIDTPTAAYIDKIVEDITAKIGNNNSLVSSNLVDAITVINQSLWDMQLSLSRDRHETRHDYLSSKNPVPLSELLQTSMAECVEIAVVSHMALSNLGIKSRLVVGGVFDEQPAGSLKEEYPDDHAYLLLQIGQGDIIYDPFDRITQEPSTDMSDTTYIPSLYLIPKNSRELLKNASQTGGKPPVYLEAKPRFSFLKNRFYGIGQAYIQPEYKVLRTQ